MVRIVLLLQSTVVWFVVQLQIVPFLIPTVASFHLHNTSIQKETKPHDRRQYFHMFHSNIDSMEQVYYIM